MRPWFELPDEVGATPGGGSGRPYRDAVDQTYSISANRRPQVQRGIDANIGTAHALPGKGLSEATPPWEMLPSGLGRKMLTGGSSALMAIVANPEHPLAKFIRTAYPKMYKHLVKSPEAWKFFIGNRRSSMEGLPDLWRGDGAGGATTRLGHPVPGADRALGVRQDVWKHIKNDTNEHADVIPGHEMQHAVQSTGRLSPTGKQLQSRARRMAALPASETTGARLSELLNHSGQREFARGYDWREWPAQEGLTQAAGLEATRRAKKLGLYEQARKGMLEKEEFSPSPVTGGLGVTPNMALSREGIPMQRRILPRTPANPNVQINPQSGKGFDEQAYRTTQPVEVTYPNMPPFRDAVKGLNVGHAGARAKANWEGSIIELLKEME